MPLRVGAIEATGANRDCFSAGEQGGAMSGGVDAKSQAACHHQAQRGEMKREVARRSFAECCWVAAPDHG